MTHTIEHRGMETEVYWDRGGGWQLLFPNGNADVTPGESVRVFGSFQNKGDKAPIDMTFKVGDACFLESWSAVSTKARPGVVHSITAKQVKVEIMMKGGYPKVRTMKLATFCWAQWRHQKALTSAS